MFPKWSEGGLRIAKCEIGDGPSDCVLTLILGIGYDETYFTKGTYPWLVPWLWDSAKLLPLLGPGFWKDS